jgi:hypothetical protein
LEGYGAGGLEPKAALQRFERFDAAVAAGTALRFPLEPLALSLLLPLFETALNLGG